MRVLRCILRRVHFQRMGGGDYLFSLFGDSHSFSLIHTSLVLWILFSSLFFAFDRHSRMGIGPSNFNALSLNVFFPSRRCISNLVCGGTIPRSRSFGLSPSVAPPPRLFASRESIPFSTGLLFSLPPPSCSLFHSPPLPLRGATTIPPSPHTCIQPTSRASRQTGSANGGFPVISSASVNWLDYGETIQFNSIRRSDGWIRRCVCVCVFWLRFLFLVWVFGRRGGWGFKWGWGLGFE